MEGVGLDGRDVIGNGVEDDVNDGNCLGNGNKREQDDEKDALGNNSFNGLYGDRTIHSPTEKYARYYKMDHVKRGIAYIFNHENFEIMNLKSRSGTEADCKNLKETLIKLGFEVIIFKDLKKREVDEQIQHAARKDYSNHDCIIVSVLSHGETGIIYAKDTCYKPDTLWLSFTPENCPTLAGKPKIFFLQACQGDQLDRGVTMFRTTETDGHSIETYRIPMHADFLIVCSTIKGYYSWRNTTKGSWFIQALCEEMRERGFKEDLLTILTFVSQRVAFDFESNVPDSPSMHRQKQIPCVMSMLTRLIQFKKTGSNTETKIVEEKEKNKCLFSGIFSKGKVYNIN